MSFLEVEADILNLLSARCFIKVSLWAFVNPNLFNISSTADFALDDWAVIPNDFIRLLNCAVFLALFDSSFKNDLRDWLLYELMNCFFINWAKVIFL